MCKIQARSYEILIIYKCIYIVARVRVSRAERRIRRPGVAASVSGDAVLAHIHVQDVRPFSILTIYMCIYIAAYRERMGRAERRTRGQAGA